MTRTTHSARYSIDSNAPQNLANQLAKHLQSNRTGQLPKALAKHFIVDTKTDGTIFYAYTPKAHGNRFSGKKPLGEPKHPDALIGASNQLVFTNFENFKEQTDNVLALLKSDTNNQPVIAIQLRIIEGLFNLHPGCKVVLKQVSTDVQLENFQFDTLRYKVFVYSRNKILFALYLCDVCVLVSSTSGLARLHQLYDKLSADKAQLKKQMKAWEKCY